MQDYKVILKKDKTKVLGIIKMLCSKDLDEKQVSKIFYKNALNELGPISKASLFLCYRELKKSAEVSLSIEEEKRLLNVIKMKHTRTISGVTPVTVLTKPFPCPGDCIFCPNDIKMPKSYLQNEPGAQRALSNKFDPYYQTYNRLVAFRNTGHPTDKIELIILGGTWSVYPESYQIWFVKRCFDALNDFDPQKAKTKNPAKVEMPFNIKSEDRKIKYNTAVAKFRVDSKEGCTWEELFKVQEKNESSKSRCVGLVIETRPDKITTVEVIKIRKLGATKIQMGVQSLNDKVLEFNKRGHSTKQTENAFNLIRQAGFKIHIHWMPNLYQSSIKEDILGYASLFTNVNLKPDEVKIYPCSLIENTELVNYFNKGLWKPYSHEELLQVLKKNILDTPRYCRITRVIRDISSTDIIAGNKVTNIRQDAENLLISGKQNIQEIRFREVKNEKITPSDLILKITKYKTAVSLEYFLEFVTSKDKIAAFLRLSLPSVSPYIKELKDCAIIREVHVYGQSLGIHERTEGKAQHLGLGKQLINKSLEHAKKNKYKKVAVISSVGTREYYGKLGFYPGNIYQFYDL